MGYSGIKKPEIQTLPIIEDRISFLYLKECHINRQDGAIAVTDKTGVTLIPAGTLSVLILGPGTSITHRAMELIGNMGVSVVWTGEQGVKYYASGSALTHRSTLLQQQAKLVSNQRKHLAVVRKMYIMRFPNEDVSKLTLQQLRGREGARIRKVYRQEADKWNINWSGREYKLGDPGASNLVNAALSVGNSCLYGLAHSVICALGCSPGLGFVHVGHDFSFVYDIADLYKTDTSIPIAFEAAHAEASDIESYVRKKMRDKFVEIHLLEKMVKDIKYLFQEQDNARDKLDESMNEATDEDDVLLWDDKIGTVKNGISY